MAVSPSRSRSVSQPRSSATPSASLFSNIYIELAFLRAIAAYRPLGQHKHFNLVPILRDLDRAIQAEQARRKRQNLPPLQDTLEGADEKAANAQISAKGKAKADGQGQDGLAISAQEVWERLEELYDLEALDELVSAL